MDFSKGKEKAGRSRTACWTAGALLASKKVRLALEGVQHNEQRIPLFLQPAHRLIQPL